MSANPARFVGDHLVATYDGPWWAVWAFDAPAYRRSPLSEKLALHDRLAAAAMLMPGDWMALGVSVPVGPDAVARSMSAHVDLDANPGWRRRVASGRSGLETAADRGRGAQHRLHFIAATLDEPPGRDWRAPLSAAHARFGRSFGLTPPPVRAGVFAAYRRVADDLEAVLARPLHHRLRPATTAEILWLYARGAARGGNEPALVDFGSPTVRAEGEGDGAGLRCAALVDLDDADYFEGGTDDDVDRPAHRRYLRVNHGAGTTYQSVLALADMPERWQHPGVIDLSTVDTLGFPVDWCIRVSSTSNAETQAAVRKQLRELDGQYEERAGDSAGTGPGLDRAVEVARAEWAELAASPGAPGLKVTFLFALGADTLPELDRRTARLRGAFGASEWQMHAPSGHQDALHGAMAPAGRWSAPVGHYQQYLLPKGLAGCAWAAGNRVGDAEGALLGFNLDAGLGSPVFFSPANGPRSGHAGSFALVGKLGSGKSHTVKTVLVDTVERGGVVVVTDRTGGAGGAEGEYVRLRHIFSPTKRTVVVPVGGSGETTCLDPLAVFSGDYATRYATGFLTLLTRTAPTDPQGAVLDEAVRRVADAGGRLADVGPELDRMGTEDDDARGVAKKLRVFSRAGGLADVAFGRGEPLALDADYIVFHAPHLQLPEPEQLADPGSLLPEQVVGMGIVYLIAAVARSVITADDSRFGLFVQDEGYVMTASAQGRLVLREIARDGRKRNGGLAFASHHPADIGDDRLAELFTTRFVFRMDATAAADGLAFVGLEDTPANRALLSESSRAQGECLVRFLDGSVGLVRTMEAPTAAARVAFDTTPGAPPVPLPSPPRFQRRLARSAR